MSSKFPNLAPQLHDSALVEPSRMTGEDRRRQLIQVAIRLFSQKGFTGTTTKEIAAAAHVNEAMIFRHFATKDDLYAAILDYKAHEVCAGDWLEELRYHAAARDDRAVFHLVAEKKLTHHRCDEKDQFLRLMFYSALEGHTLAHVFLERQARPISDFLCNYIEQRQREGAFRQMHPRATVTAFIGALNHYVMMNAFFPDWRLELSDEEAATHFTNLLFTGLCAKQNARTSGKGAGKRTAAKRTAAKPLTKSSTKPLAKAAAQTTAKPGKRNPRSS